MDWVHTCHMGSAVWMCSMRNLASRACYSEFLARGASCGLRPPPLQARPSISYPRSSSQPSALWFGVFYGSNSSVSVLQFPALKLCESSWNSSLQKEIILKSLYSQINAFSPKIILSAITFLVTQRHARSFSDLVIIMHINFHCISC